MTQEQKEELIHAAVEEMKKQAPKKEEPAKEETSKNSDDKTIEDVFNELTEEQKKVVYALIGMAIEQTKNEQSGKKVDSSKEVKQSEYEGDSEMGMIQNNVFERQNVNNVLSHDEINDIFKDAQKCGSLKESVLEHSATYGIDSIDNLFPDSQLVGDPSTIQRNDEWVTTLLNGVNKTPFARIKSIAFDITATAARAKGYIKGDKKVEEVITSLKRTTSPQTIYKKQKLDRDDILDITDFDTVAYLKSEMKTMLNEEIARAVLIGDGRLAEAADKISTSCVRPIAFDDDTYTIKKVVTIASNATNKQVADAIIEADLKARKDYKGSGNPVMFCSPDYLTTMLLAEDSMGRKIYNTDAELASSLRVSKIVEVPVMENATYTGADSKVYDIIAVILNLKDYTIGADKKGEINMFDDFDLDYNQNRYLIETRISGALIKPYSVITIAKEHTTSAG